MKRIRVRIILLYIWLLSFIGPMLVAALYECDILLAGGKADQNSSEFIAVAIMELVTICTIPLALRLFKLPPVARRLALGKDNVLLRWSVLRMLLIGIPVWGNTLFYYFYMNVSFAYMAIIGGLSLLFIYPSKGKCKMEISGEHNETDGCNSKL